MPPDAARTMPGPACHDRGAVSASWGFFVDRQTCPPKARKKGSFRATPAMQKGNDNQKDRQSAKQFGYQQQRGAMPDL